MNTILWTPKAARELRKLPRRAQVAIRDDVGSKLTRFPDCTGVKALVAHAYRYRLRVGNFRVLFDYDGAVHVIRIEAVGKRNERTY